MLVQIRSSAARSACSGGCEEARVSLQRCQLLPVTACPAWERAERARVGQGVSPPRARASGTRGSFPCPFADSWYLMSQHQPSGQIAATLHHARATAARADAPAFNLLPVSARGCLAAEICSRTQLFSPHCPSWNQLHQEAMRPSCPLDLSAHLPLLDPARAAQPGTAPTSTTHQQHSLDNAHTCCLGVRKGVAFRRCSSIGIAHRLREEWSYVAGGREIVRKVGRQAEGSAPPGTSSRPVPATLAK